MINANIKKILLIFAVVLAMTISSCSDSDKKTDPIITPPPDGPMQGTDGEYTLVITNNTNSEIWGITLQSATPSTPEKDYIYLLEAVDGDDHTRVPIGGTVTFKGTDVKGQAPWYVSSLSPEYDVYIRQVNTLPASGSTFTFVQGDLFGSGGGGDDDYIIKVKNSTNRKLDDFVIITSDYQHMVYLFPIDDEDEEPLLPGQTKEYSLWGDHSGNYQWIFIATITDDDDHGYMKNIGKFPASGSTIEVKNSDYKGN